MTDRDTNQTDDFDPNDASRNPGDVLGGTMDAPPNPTADHFARETVGGELEDEKPIVQSGEVDDEPELPTRIHEG